MEDLLCHGVELIPLNGFIWGKVSAGIGNVVQLSKAPLCGMIILNGVSALISFGSGL